MAMNPSPNHTQISQTAIRRTGERVTQPRVTVLATLATFDHAASHLEIASAIGSDASRAAIDRVTVYRVLDWLVGVNLAHRIAGDDRVWRYVANLGSNKAENTKAAKATPSRFKPIANAHQHHAHFTCEACGQTFCLGDVQPKVTVKLPTGFTSNAVDVKLRGRCAHCSGAVRAKAA
jgi:Fur family transcriptional regulator, ferric uptake regulator